MKLSVIVLFLLAALLIVCIAPALAQVVSPLQSGHYMTGITNIRDMSYPPPGLFLMWYNVWISSDRYIDRNGNELTGLRLSEIDPELPDIDLKFDVGGFASVPTLFWASHFTFLGGARYLAGISPNYMTTDGTLMTQTWDDVSDSTVTKVETGSVSGFSDLFVAPVGLSWALGLVDLTVVYGFAAPTGRYTTGADDNLGLGFWTHQFQGFGYLYPDESQATALMAGLTYELNSEIKDEAVKPGSRLSLEWGMSHYFTGWLELGVQGAHNWQITDDTGADVFWDPSAHDRKSTLLFSAGVWPVAGRLYLAAKYGFDFGVRQRFKGNSLMLHLIWITNALDGQ